MFGIQAALKIDMRISCNHSGGGSSQKLRRRGLPSDSPAIRAFTLIEVLITVALMLLRIASSFSALMFLNRSSSSLSGYVAAMAAVQGKVEKIRALTYNPPSGNYFKSTTTRWPNNQAIFLNKAGTNLLVTGTVVAEIQPTGTNVGAGHLVTVTGTFATPGKPTVVTLQTIVNKFSGGQQ